MGAVKRGCKGERSRAVVPLNKHTPACHNSAGWKHPTRRKGVRNPQAAPRGHRCTESKCCRPTTNQQYTHVRVRELNRITAARAAGILWALDPDDSRRLEMDPRGSATGPLEAQTPPPAPTPLVKMASLAEGCGACTPEILSAQ
jgi:hypothetical protein